MWEAIYKSATCHAAGLNFVFPVSLTPRVVVQEAVKGSQGAGRVDDALDSTIEGNEPVAELNKPKGPARPAGAKGKRKGRR